LDGKPLLYHSRNKYFVALKYRISRKNSCLSDKKIIVTVPHEYIIQETEMSSVKKDESSLRSDELFIRNTFKRTAEY
jgi:hypothetical protein